MEGTSWATLKGAPPWPTEPDDEMAMCHALSERAGEVDTVNLEHPASSEASEPPRPQPSPAKLLTTHQRLATEWDANDCDEVLTRTMGGAGSGRGAALDACGVDAECLASAMRAEVGALNCRVGALTGATGGWCLEGSWPGIPHHMILFGPRYKGLLDDIYDHGVLPQDFSIYLHHPTVTDPSMAPEGMSTFYALVPVAHMGKLAVDWEEMGPLLEKRILDELERRLIPDIHSRIVTKFHYAPRDFAMDLNAHMGSAFSLEPVLTQSAWFRGHNRDDVIDNFYLVGAGTHPGAGIPGVVGSAKATAGLMIEDLAV